MSILETKICVIGLGYVGLPLAVEFSKQIPVVGFDINPSRIEDLKDGIDVTNELNADELKQSGNLLLSSNKDDIKNSSCYIVTVPTPIDSDKNPDLSPLMNASNLVGDYLQEGDTVIFESTVYPGATEEVCVPILESSSNLEFNKDFFIGYSPERINPGDKEHRLPDIQKVVSGSNLQTLDFVDNLYKLIILAGTYRAESIKVAEAAKVIENTQRDLNIALINELAIIFGHLDIDTESVLRAAETKWNFLPFRPGLVGGHCIGVDPYYLTYKAQQIGYQPEIILSGRKLNDNMSKFVSNQLLDNLNQKDSPRILIMGLSFKENCPDIRNSKIIDIYHHLHGSGCKVDIYDPWVSHKTALNEFGIEAIPFPEKGVYDGIIIAVGHNEFRDMGCAAVREFGAADHILYDLKYIFKQSEVDLRL
ncbi:nucleotide sugar dehydrogenase [Gammaproteobacteria bacterium]|nr:nucleotide sugar dehydrogenase [Gammaproteobacteria bacterium]